MKPIRCKIIIEKIKLRPELKIMSLPWPIMLATIKVINMTAIEGEKGLRIFVTLGDNIFNERPIPTGNSTTFRVLKNRPHASTSR